jgi:hypothetical protein
MSPTMWTNVPKKHNFLRVSNRGKIQVKRLVDNGFRKKIIIARVQSFFHDEDKKDRKIGVGKLLGLKSYLNKYG